MEGGRGAALSVTSASKRCRRAKGRARSKWHDRERRRTARLWVDFERSLLEDPEALGRRPTGRGYAHKEVQPASHVRMRKGRQETDRPRPSSP